MGGFQSQVNVLQAPAVLGDFCDANPRYTVDAGQGGLVCGPGGVLVGRFAWLTNPDDSDGAPSIVNNFGIGPVAGFVHREQQGLIEVYLQESSLLVPAGFPITLFSGGGFWVKNDGATQVTPGLKAYANFADGKATFAATGTPTAGATSTGSTITPETSSFTGSIADSVLTVTGAVTGTIYAGTTISGSGVSSGTMIVAQLSGTAGGDGTYSVSIPGQTVASTVISGTYGLLTIGTATGTFHVGDLLAATGSVAAGTSITQSVTGGSSSGTMVVNNNTNVTSQVIDVAAINVETKWIAMSSGAAGELVKISSQPLG